MKNHTGEIHSVQTVCIVQGLRILKDDASLDIKENLKYYVQHLRLHVVSPWELGRGN